VGSSPIVSTDLDWEDFERGSELAQRDLSAA
jgi:hypothetical protein